MTHTPQEKLAAHESLREVIALWFFRELFNEQRIKLFSMCGLAPDELPQHGAQRRALDHLLSEHGGGGEAVGYATQDGGVIWYADGPGSASRKPAPGTVLYTTQPTPSAPVVDDALLDEVASWLPFDGDDNNIRARFATFRAALSGVSAPVGVDEAMKALRWYAEQAGLCRKLGRTGDAGRHALDGDGGKRARVAIAALNPQWVEYGLAAGFAYLKAEGEIYDVRDVEPEIRGEFAPCNADGSTEAPAAAPRVEEPVVDLMDYENQERAAASEDGLPFNFDDGGPYNGIDWQATCEALQAEVAELRRRLAASGQGVEWQPIATLPTDDTLILAGCADGRIMVYRADILARNITGPTPEHLRFPADGWMPLPAAPTQEKA